MSLYEAHEKDAKKPLAVKYFRNAESLPEHVRAEPDAFPKYILVPFLNHCWEESSSKLAPLNDSTIICCLATAGVVMNNQVNMTNLGNLHVNGAAIANDTSNPYLCRIRDCTIINDFVAQGYGCLTLHPSEVRLLHGPPEASLLTNLVGPKVCVGAGTGLGECYLTPSGGDDSNAYTCYPSEGGHVEYAPRHSLEADLWKFLIDKFSGNGRVSVERVVSGTGLANVYEFLVHSFPERKDEHIHKLFLAAGDEQGRVVGENATLKNSLCNQAMKIMMAAYGTNILY
jgi:glucokinase